MQGNCDIQYDWFTTFLTFGLCVGLIVSYLPQHLRIIQTKSSEGLSPLFLLLGSTSAASALLNMITVQSGVLKCCSTLGPTRCLDISAGVVQLSIQWVCFTLVFVLYMLYYPERLKHEGVQLPTDSATVVIKSPILQNEWRTIHHLLMVDRNSLVLPLPASLFLRSSTSWGKFLGVSAAAFATVQYMPQLIHTYRTKLVGALSIPMMCIQSPGGVLMVLSIALRPGTNWTSWITFAVAARLGIDDFGVPLGHASNSDLQVDATVSVEGDDVHPAGSPVAIVAGISDERTPLLSNSNAR
ncbi:hypothetical protein FA13DRAFT_1736979 [Coprinellus micaceus]|uniref:PQ loop repeat protein n=1 Tax=Coprinellus micaceus TaxID=71717 RepID=A0A4Y7SZA6_COPMI|nr:hypothetical protein FA13DRAFT_1736979 [Coprinellus micaceus]